MTIGEKIKIRRKELKLTQEQLAIKAGYSSKTTINKIEKDKIEVPINKIEIIAKALNLKPQYLTGWNIEDKIYYDEKLLNDSQIKELNTYLDANTAMYFNGIIEDNEDNKKILKEALTKAYIEILANKGEI